MKAWIHSLVAAAIAAFSTSVTAAIADPSSFNFSTKGAEHILAVGGLAAVVAVLALLKQSPLPPSTAGTGSGTGISSGTLTALQQTLASNSKPLACIGIALILLSVSLCVMGCGVPTFLTDMEAIIPVAGSAIAGILALAGGLTGNAVLEAAAAAVTALVTKIDAELTQVNDLISQYKANPSDTLLENIEAAIALVNADLANILEIAGLPDAIATRIQTIVQAVVAQLEALLSVLPVFKSSTAGQSLAVVKPVSASTFKAQIHAALASGTTKPAAAA